MKVTLSHPTSNANVRAIAMGLAQAQMLEAFYTSIASFPGSALEKLGRVNFLSEINRRSFDPLLKPYTHMWPWWEVGRMVSTKAKLNNLVRHEQGVFSIDKIYHNLDEHVASKLRSGADKAVYAYEDGALATFTKARSLGIARIYDLPIAYWQIREEVMTEEALRLPEWAPTLGGLNDSPEKLQRKTEELQLADVVVSPSSFVSDSLPEWAKGKKVIQSPFGSPVSSNSSKDIKSTDPNKPLRVLFVGSMGQRKGLGDLFEAVKLLNTPRIELVVMGSMLQPAEFYQKQLKNFTYEKGRPHAEVLELMRTCDVFCLPSLAEGRALVMQEAMSQGLPLIITSNTGGEDLIIKDETGFLVPIRSPHAIAEKLTWFLENREAVQEMGRYAQKHAATYTWEAYAGKVISEIENRQSY